MASKTKEDRLAIARRICLVLRTRTIATWRTLEQKISDAGPYPMRVDPHLLTTARNELMTGGVVARRTVGKGNTPWFHLASTPDAEIDAKLGELAPIHDALLEQDFKLRMGQTLEIAAFRAFSTQPAFKTFGTFLDLEDHDDSTLYKKEEPPSSVGRRKTSGKLDFLLTAEDGSLAGVELKNVREWLYPDRDEVKDLLRKCTDLDVLPVLIARRMPYVTFKLLIACGVVIHQTYNQLFPSSDRQLASLASDKALLGYHDIKIGNTPDARLVKFVEVNLPDLVIRMRPTYDAFKDLLADFANGSMPYSVFAATVRRRVAGTNEDNDWEGDIE